MPTDGRWTLTQFLIEERRRHPDATGDLNALVTSLALVCKAISRKVAFGSLQREAADPLRTQVTQMFLRTTEWMGVLAGIVSESLPEVCRLPAEFVRGKYLLLFDPLDPSSSVDMNVSVGSIFSVLRAARAGRDATAADFLEPGSQQVCAGYAIYGPATMLVLTLGRGTHAFTLDPLLGEWVLSHRDLRIPEHTCEFAVDSTNSRQWEPALARYVSECLAGRSGERGVDFDMRWIASLIAETHRILMRGGVFLSPGSTRPHVDESDVSLLTKANPIAFLVEQAGGRASTGRQRLMDEVPTSLRQHTGFVFGSTAEVDRIERYQRESPPDAFVAPLFARRGLFADAD